MNPMPFEVAVVAQPLVAAGLPMRWVPPEEWPFSWMRDAAHGFLLAECTGRITPTQRRAVRAAGAHWYRLANRDFVVAEIEPGLVLGVRRDAAMPGRSEALGLRTLYFGGGSHYVSEDKSFHDAHHASHMRARETWWKKHGHYGEYQRWLAAIDDATTRRFVLWWFLLESRWQASRA